MTAHEAGAGEAGAGEAGASDAGGRQQVPAVRALLLAFTVLTLVATNQLYVRAGSTADGFAWTIQPPLTAALLGGGYAAGCVLVVLSLRGRVWATARVGYLTVLVFVVLALIATLLHHDRFHFGVDALVPRAAAWIWLAVYVAVPVTMLAALPRQVRASGTDRRSGVRLGRGLRWSLGLQAAVLVAVGSALYVLDGTRGWWPWTLTELTARMVAAWLIALGVGATLALRQDDLARLRPAAVTYTVLGVLQLAAVLRFRATLDADRVATWVYVVAVLSILAVGAAGLVSSRRTPPPEQQRSHRTTVDGPVGAR